VSRFPSFGEFYAAANDGRAPFPWQQRLAELVAAHGWPAEIGVPTGLGKTACLDIGLWALASQAERPSASRTLPTRIWYVVNRRLLVDAAYDHGQRLEQMLLDPDASTPIARIADALRSMSSVAGTSDTPVTISRIRGGADLGARAPHPAQPSIVFATVPMFASAWLFRGYASSTSMRPVDAAHAGIDSLVLLDEAHLSEPLVQLLEPVSLCDIGDPAGVVPPDRARPRLVALTATGDVADPFELDGDDLSHPVIQQRLNAPKPTSLLPSPRRGDAVATDLADALESTLSGLNRPGAAVVFVNSPRTARAVFDRLQTRRGKKGGLDAQAELVLLTGRMRRREASEARALVLDPARGAPSGWDRARQSSGHLVVVATQTLEVGADLDFDVLVTESCGTRSLVQRLGRLNRLGAVGDASATVVHSTKESEWGIYGEEPAQVWERLEANVDSDGAVQLGPGTIGTVLGAPADRPTETAELLPFHLWEWAKTTTPPHGEAPIEPFYEGFETDGPRATVCWRATEFEPGDRLVPSLGNDDSVDLPLGELRSFLTERLGEEGEVIRLARDRVTVELAATSSLRPGDSIVLGVDVGGYDRHGWAPESTSPVLDVSLSRWPGIPLDKRTLKHWVDPDAGWNELVAAVELTHRDDVEDEEIVATATAVLEALEPRAELVADWQEALGQIQGGLAWFGEIPTVARRQERRARASALLAADAFDDLSADATSTGLDDHLASVGELASRIAAAVGLPEELVAAVEAAGRFHDLGKADARFQRWLDPRAESSALLAKSSTPRSRWRAARTASGWPAGGRHEAISGRLLADYLDQQPNPGWDADLVSHLVVSHHGHGRPLVEPAAGGAPTDVTVQADGTDLSCSGDLAEVDWDQPRRFRVCCERYGYWGLALLEAIVRQADHLASSQAGGSVEVA
jgi:CRISPR-associated endonuclease/helicase Cas3